ncbi:MAG: hypothetical protein AB9Q19_12675 [Candidatus Reddybacter sp.]
MPDKKLAHIADVLIDLAELLSTDDCEITAGEILENITGRSISKECAGDIRDRLYK